MMSQTELPAKMPLEEFTSSDFYHVFTEFVKGKVPHKMLNNCQLYFKCKSCKEIQPTFEKYAKHFEECMLIKNENENSMQSIIDMQRNPFKEKRRKDNFKCVVCSEEFGSSYRFKKHCVLVNSDADIFTLKCKLCEFKSNSSTLCIVHARKSHNVAASTNKILEYFWNLKCKTQTEQRNLKNARRERRRIELVDKRFRCKLCVFESVSVLDCKKHARFSHKRNTASRKNFCSIFAKQNLESLVESGSGSLEEIGLPTVPVEVTINEGLPKNLGCTDAVDEYCVVLKNKHDDIVDYRRIFCKLCEKSFINLFILRQHLAVFHLGFGRYKCRNCEFTSTQVNECKKHSLDAHNVKCASGVDLKMSFHELQCIPMEKPKMVKDEPKKKLKIGIFKEKKDTSIYKTENGYCVILDDEHQSKVDHESKLCLLCNKKFRTHFLMRKHLALAHLGYERYKCKLCDFKSSLVNECNGHARLFHAVQITTMYAHRIFFDEIKCAFPIVSMKNAIAADKKRTLHYCQTFGDSENYAVVLENDYEDIVDYERNFCRLCNQKFSDSYSARQHLAVDHLGFARYKCELCKFMTSSSSECTEHVSKIHNDVCSFYEIQCLPSATKRLDNMEERGLENGACNEPKELSVDTGRNSETIPASRYKIIADNSKYIVVLDDDYRNIVDYERNFCLECNRSLSKGIASLKKHLAIIHLGFARYRCKLCEFMNNSSVECAKHAKDIHDIMCSNRSFRKCFHDIRCITRTKKAESVERAEISPSQYQMIADDAKYWVVLKEEYKNLVDLENRLCRECNQNFKSKHSVRQHLAVIHLGFKRYKCSLCDFFCSSIIECREHSNDIHNIICPEDTFPKFFFNIKCITPEMSANTMNKIPNYR